MDMNGTNYANYRLLLPLVSAPFLSRVLARWPRQTARLAETLDRLHAMFLAEGATRGLLVWEAIPCGHKSAPTYFCSELIVYIYECLGLDIARDNALSSSFRPDDLCNEGRSLLVSVELVRAQSPIQVFKHPRRDRDLKRTDAD